MEDEQEKNHFLDISEDYREIDLLMYWYVT